MRNRSSAEVRPLFTRWLGLLAVSVFVVAGTPATGGAQSQDAGTASFEQVPGDVVSEFVDRYGMDRRIAQAYIGLTPDVRAWTESVRRELGDSFAGAWRDPRNGLDVQLYVTEQAREEAEILRESFTRPELVRVSVVPLSVDQLEVGAEKIASDIPRLVEEGLDVSIVGADLRTNMVVAQLASFSEERARSLEERYPGIPLSVMKGDQVRTASDCGSRTNCTNGFPPWDMRGGIEVFSTGATCSTAFGAVRVPDDRPMVLTAGHCFDGAEETFHGPFISVGPVTRSQFRGTVDGASVAPSTTTWGVENWVYYRDAVQHQPITAVEGRHFTAGIGDPVCQAGITLGWTCGTIDDVGQTVNINDNGNIVTLTDQNISDMCAIPGDSGASVFQPTSLISGEAHGIISASNWHEENGQPVCDPDPFTIYPRAVNVENELDVRI